MRMARRLDGPGRPYEGLTRIGKRGVDWSGRVRLVPEQLTAPLRVRKPTTWFVNSMSDLFHEALTDEEIAAVFGVMAACPQHTFQVLTKRAKRMRRWFEWVELPEMGGRCGTDPCITAALGVPELNRFLEPREVIYDDEPGPWDHLIEDPPEWPLSNVWLGVSAEDQERYDERVVDLVHGCPAAVRFVSMEPLLGPINLKGTGRLHLDWVIVGGESGHGARPCDVEWIRNITRECQNNGIACFVKQLGAKPSMCGSPVVYQDDPELGGVWTSGTFKSRKGNDPDEWPPDFRIRQMPQVHP